MAVYCVRLSSPLGNDRHRAEYYIGYADDNRVIDRLYEHEQRRGARMLAVAVERGITFETVFVVDGVGRAVERGMKRQKNARRLAEQYNRNPARFVKKWQSYA